MSYHRHIIFVICFQDGWKKTNSKPSHEHPFNEKTERKSYIKNANKIKSQIRFKKVAYPDYIGAETQSGISEPLLEKNRSACRAKVLQNLRIILNEVDESEQNVVYDLDELIIRDENNNNKPRELRSDDDFLIFTNQTASVDTPWDQQKRKHLLFESRFECGNLRLVSVRYLSSYLVTMKYYSIRNRNNIDTIWYIFQESDSNT